MNGWKNIVQIAAGSWHTVGLRVDGTVVATGYNEYGQFNVSGWSDIVAIDAGDWATVGLKRDGSVTLQKIGEAAFVAWDAVTTVTFAKGCAIEEIPKDAFGLCTHLKSIQLPPPYENETDAVCLGKKIEDLLS